MDVYHKILEKYWGYPAFRPLQEDIIHSVCEGKDTLGLMPTGGGKSITFQVPALAMEGICIVVTPLIALMKDQVDNLRRLGIKATAVYSGMTRQEIIAQLENCIFGDYKFLYVSPERLGTDIFKSKLQAMNVCLLVIDESHCISQWGYDFRPSYLSIADIREELPGVPVLALTATATPEVVNDIQERLHFREKNVFRKSFVRKNLSYIVRQTEDKINSLIYILGKVPGTAIVYVRNRKRTKEIAVLLQQAGISADFFHAGLNRDDKNLRQSRWKNNECRVIVSTNAFGMGIDKPDVRLVIHMDMPGSLEEYYQEAGRAGRDEQRAYAVALCSNIDCTKLKKRLADEFPDRDFISRVYDALGNYYQIAMGFGLDTVHDFSLVDFCTVYKFSHLQTHHALKILELAGYIEYTEEQENASRLVFTATRDELYKYLHQDKKTDEVIQTILRSYTGLFSDYVYINEGLISTRTGLSQQEIYEVLVRLSKYRIVNYIPHKKTPLIIYTRTREEIKYLSIPRSAYEERKKRFESRINRVMEYINENRICRSRMLISYFGEKGTSDCGCCDVCLAKNDSGLNNHTFNTIRDALKEALTDGPQEAKKLTENLPFPADKIITVIRYLADHDEHFSLEDGIISLTKMNTMSDNEQ
ncbi:RecQ family ATP-dependent DNA helicase [Parabacteroides goldsteinii]|uniref:ATP-dependent DNA helicase RecQ n=2 Tax=Parabacteroides goldsteinii TaxID=328812 RepID=A0A6G1ZL18_9BACT|nr:RecQ family ATP-dependent DNA helicase [Parabacteroides goldsteinii]MRX94992.1 RecQ family ATP-dependent DNA helicase [Parabacteroides goldsteinii]MRY00055.1 RecQ family ATP-dependent DNA helicase [Parabacteroides goldsteinii]MRY05040.1 RecQ family ATP-dependent DNA helicase [Parabacteroides goldsteinii]MRY14570.1 RecQ family ATP-dependent DNA helicase [Parabacteroides goldsteinii]MRY23847.1 RecQ family ATP-dependent DNA helicase [Parabacteroides goldsteinii]